jgi:tetratricopeptide (TPR) repeat protein
MAVSKSGKVFGFILIDIRDIMVLQNNIASAIVNKVQAGIAPLEAMKLSPPHRVDPRAYDAYMKGRGYWSRGRNNGKPGDMDKSLEQFRLAIQYDPNYAPAYAGLANYYGLAAGAGDMTPKDGWQLCEEYAQKALALDPSSAEAHLALASKMMFYPIPRLRSATRRRATRIFAGLQEKERFNRC